MDTIKIKLDDIKKIEKSNKDFLIYRLNENREIVEYKLTNDAARDRNKFPHLALLEANKIEIQNIKLKLKTL